MKTASQNAEQHTKTVRNDDQTDVMSPYKKVVSGLDSCNIILSAVVCGTCVADPDTFVTSEDHLGLFGKGNSPCNTEENLHAGHLVIEAWFRGY